MSLLLLRRWAMLMRHHYPNPTERTYNMQVPGFGGDEIRQSGNTGSAVTRRVNMAGYQGRLAAIRDAKAKK